jgi:hypothetical protein
VRARPLEVPASFEDRIDPDFDRDVLAGWRTQGEPLIRRHWHEFGTLLYDVGRAMDRGHLADAAAKAQIAAWYACFWHPGVFYSSTLETYLREIGKRAMPLDLGPRPAPRRAGRMRVLHVATQVGAIGGHVRMLWRWIGEDAANTHSVALTRQFGAIPDRLVDAVEASGGAVHLINHTPGSYLNWARKLQRHMHAADLVVLHSNSMDILPFIALGGFRDRPPVIVLNHSDHMFWLGAGVADSVVNTRASGHELCIRRRNIGADRNLRLPLCLEPAVRERSKEEAKAELGIDPERIVLLSIARGVKYRRLGTVTYADLFLPVLSENPSVQLIVIGPGEQADWAEACALVPGRITALPETPNTRPYLEAADIYVDSFPFPSNTSLFEAGLAGLPLVSFFPFGEDCEVMGADSFGFDSTILRPRSRDELVSTLSDLIADKAARHALGERAKRSIEATNMGPSWSKAITDIYVRTLAMTQRARPRETAQAPEFSDLDVFQPFAFGNPTGCRSMEDRRRLIVDLEIRALPLAERFRYCAAELGQCRFASRQGLTTIRYLFPEWFLRRAQSAGRRSRIFNGLAG